MCNFGETGANVSTIQVIFILCVFRL